MSGVLLIPCLNGQCNSALQSPHRRAGFAGDLVSGSTRFEQRSDTEDFGQVIAQAELSLLALE
jgi:hypothetical protein